ncbi:MAG: hypothetical protein Q8K60_02705 [Parachlamydiaceae bacterium]|nr:hypothetical protein [Parachlamydiaceae bacterium]
MALDVKSYPINQPLKCFYNQIAFVIKNNLGDERPEPKWIEKTGNGFLYLLKQPYKLVTYFAGSFKNPLMITIYLTTSALFGNAWLFYSKETSNALNQISNYTFRVLPKILKQYVPTPLQWTPKFTACVFTSAIISAIGIRAIGRFFDEALMAEFHSTKENKSDDNDKELPIPNNPINNNNDNANNINNDIIDPNVNK